MAAGGLRIIGGFLKGRRIETPRWDGLRPTSDRLRETLFNVLAPRIAGARVLDGYAGTGAVGIEALSRGAAHVTFVESDPRAVRLIEANLEHCALDRRGVQLQRDEDASSVPLRPDRDPRGIRLQPDGAAPYAIIRARFAAAAARLAREAAFDILFLDPPYGAEALQEAVEAAVPLVGPNSLLVIEHAKRDVAPAHVDDLERTRDLVSGDSALAFYGRR